MALLKRVLIAIFFIPLLITIFSVGQIVLSSFLGIVAFLMMYELREMFFIKGIVITKFISVLGLIVFFSAVYLNKTWLFAALLITFIIIIGADLFRNKIKGVLIRGSASMFIIVYIAIMFSSLYHIRSFENGSNLVLGLLLMIFITDTSAFFAGNALGKHRGLFKASPNKSVEGFLAGIVFSLLGSLILIFSLDLSVIQAIAAAISAGVFGQMGDLFESLLKRDVGVKDSSEALPGHGGILDRFDSLLMAAPVFYIILSFINLG